ncbi:MAG TPA: prolyl oligopeptidase family serine peptidase [Luteolibacter sp.]|nr:prolyl oligopeptidase family serine peptidase [Luteolibacter sp.]
MNSIKLFRSFVPPVALQCLILLGTLLVTRLAADEGFGGKISDFHGYAQHDFEHEGLKCRVVVPKEAAAGKPWIWRAYFFGHRPEVDVALLGKGYHVAWVDVIDLYGNPEAVERWNRYYRFLTETHGFAKKPALEGMSRGGLIIYNWAASNPEKVACIYADAPVCDIRSWPGGKGKGRGGRPKEWPQCLQVYGLSEEQAATFNQNPIDRLAPLAKAGVPLIHVVGDTDDVVPVAENTAIIEERYKALGGNITVIHKPGIGHKHGLDDPTPLIEFVLKHTR